ncbi:MAG: hypothetical protein WBN04_08775 [Paracoccaceae bacterium]
MLIVFYDHREKIGWKAATIAFVFPLTLPHRDVCMPSLRNETI